MKQTLPSPQYTGLRCVSCDEPVAVIEIADTGQLTVRCPGCGFCWGSRLPRGTDYVIAADWLHDHPHLSGKDLEN